MMEGIVEWKTSSGRQRLEYMKQIAMGKVYESMQEMKILAEDRQDLTFKSG